MKLKKIVEDTNQLEPKNPDSGIVEADATIGFSVEDFLNTQALVGLSFLDLQVDHRYSYSEYQYLATEIENAHWTQDEIEGMVLKDLNQEMKYTADVKITVEYSTSYDDWSGATEYEVTLYMTVLSYKEDRKLTQGIFSEVPTDVTTNVFAFSTNNDGDFLSLRKLSEDKIFIEVGHSCTRRRRIVHPMSLTKLLFNYELGHEE